MHDEVKRKRLEYVQSGRRLAGKIRVWYKRHHLATCWSGFEHWSRFEVHLQCGVVDKTMKEMVGGCCVCSDDSGWAENPLVYCDGTGCSVAVHQACYGITTVPSGPWFCRKCESQERAARVRCELCPSKDGALKRTDGMGWAHIVCALYIPEVRFGNVTTMEPIVLQQVPNERYKQPCYICEEAGKESKAAIGACMQCNKANCKQYFHVTCAQINGLLCEEAGNFNDNVKYCGYCSHHYNRLVSQSEKVYMKDSKRFTLVSAQKKDYSIKPIPAFRPIPTVGKSPDTSPEKRSPAMASGNGGAVSGSSGLGTPTSSHHSRRDTGGDTKTSDRVIRDPDLPATPGSTYVDHELVRPPKKTKSSAKSSASVSGSGSGTIEHCTTSGGGGGSHRASVSSSPKTSASSLAAVSGHGGGGGKSSWDNLIAAASKPSSVKPPKSSESYANSSNSSSLSGNKGDSLITGGGKHRHKLDTSGQYDKKDLDKGHLGSKGSGGGLKSDVLSASEKRNKRKLSTNSLASRSPSPPSSRSDATSPPSSSTSSSTTTSSLCGGLNAGSLDRPLTPPKPFSAALSAHFPNKLSPALIKSGSEASGGRGLASGSSGDKSSKFGGDEWPPLKRSKQTESKSAAAAEVAEKGKKKGPRASSAKETKAEKKEKTVSKVTASNGKDHHSQVKVDDVKVVKKQRKSSKGSKAVEEASRPGYGHELSGAKSSTVDGVKQRNSNGADHHLPPATTPLPSSGSAHSIPIVLDKEPYRPQAKAQAAATGPGAAGGQTSSAQLNGHRSNDRRSSSPSPSPLNNPAQNLANLGHSVDMTAERPVCVPLAGLLPPSQSGAKKLVLPKEPTEPTPHSLEQLLERQWSQGTQFVLAQAQHFDIASLLSCLSQLRQENEHLEERTRNLVSRREHLVAVNARLSIPLNGQQLAGPFGPHQPGLGGQPGQPSMATFLAPTPPAIPPPPPSGNDNQNKPPAMRPLMSGGRDMERDRERDSMHSNGLNVTGMSGFPNLNPSDLLPTGLFHPNFALAASLQGQVPGLMAMPSPGSRGSSGSPFTGNNNANSNGSVTFGSSGMMSGWGNQGQQMGSNLRDTHSAGSGSSGSGSLSGRGMDLPRR